MGSMYSLPVLLSVICKVFVLARFAMPLATARGSPFLGSDLATMLCVRSTKIYIRRCCLSDGESIENVECRGELGIGKRISLRCPCCDIPLEEYLCEINTCGQNNTFEKGL